MTTFFDPFESPRGLPPWKREFFNDLCDDLIELYEEMPFDPEKPRKFLGGCQTPTDEIQTQLILFTGTAEEAAKAVEFIKSLKE